MSVDGEAPLQQGALFPMGRHLLRAIADLIDQVPDELLVLAGDDYALFVAARAVIRQSSESGTPFPGQGPGNAAVPVLPGRKFSPIRDARDCLAKCPDQVPSIAAADLAFMNDPALRSALRNDISSATSSLAHHEYKQATVMAASVIEALLLWALESTGDAVVRAHCKNSAVIVPNKPLDEWHLPEFIRAARAGQIIQADTTTLADLAKDFRNLIHPGRAQRMGAACSLGTAYAALGAVEKVSEDLARWRRNP